MTQASTLAQLASSGALSADTSGNVGVGTTTPSTYGKLAVTTPGGAGLASITNSDGGGTNGGMQLASYYGAVKVGYYNINLTNGTIGSETSYASLATIGAGALVERMRIDNLGNVGINNTSSGTYDTSGKILAVSGTATNTNPSVILMEGTSAAPGRGSFVTETFAIAGISNTATEITRITGSGSNGMSMYVRVTYTGHTSTIGNGTNYKAVRYDGGTIAVTQVETATSGSVPGITFDTSTNNVLIIKLNSSTAGQTTNGVMVVQWYIPIDFNNNTWTIS